MNCREYRRLWDEQFDARDGGSTASERVLAAHAAQCPACRALAGRYQALRQAIQVLDPPPAPPAGDSPGPAEEPGYTDEQEAIIQQRLAYLGYL